MSKALSAGSIVPAGVSSEIGSPHLSRKVYLRMRNLIEQGQLRPGARLPSTRVLSLELGVSRGTVISAFEDLVADGLVTTITGSGTFVRRAAYVASRHSDAREAPSRPGRSCASGFSEGLSRSDSLVSSASLETAMRSRFGQSFEVDVPAIDAFPFKLWERLGVRLCKRGLHSLYLQTDSAGYAPLREAIARHLAEMRGMSCDAGQIIVVTGTLQAVDLICRVLLDDKQTVWLEEPGRMCLRTIPRLMGANVGYAPVDDEGIQVKMLEEGADARIAVVTPSSHFPLGVEMSMGRRLALLRWAEARDAWIVEDDTGMELTTTGRDIPSLWSLDTKDRVIYASTFRSTMLPALRIGFVVVPPDIVESFVRMRFLADGFRPAIDQALMAEFILEGHLASHIRLMRALYFDRQTALATLVAKRLGSALTPALPSFAGGLHSVFRITEPGSSAVALSRHAVREGIIVRSVAEYHMREPVGDDLIVLGHAAAQPATFCRDVVRLARALDTAGIGR